MEDHKQDLLLLLDSHAGPGFESTVGEQVKQVFLRYTKDVTVDTLGNVIGRVTDQAGPAPMDGKRPRVMLAAHMDEIALIITAIEPGGFLRVWKTGGFDPRTLVGQEVVVHGRETLLGIIGSKPPHLLSAGERREAAPLEALFIDIAMPEEQVRSRVTIGDRVTLHRHPIELLNNRVAGKALDNRLSVAILFETLRILKTLRHGCDVFAVGTTQEEVGSDGAIVAANHLEPDIAVAIDVTFAEFHGQAPDDSFKMGGGPAITHGPNIHPKIFDRLRATAEQHQIRYQIEYSQRPTGTDARAFQIAGNGIATGLVGTALRYMHTSVEVGGYDDVIDCGRLLAHFIASLDAGFVEELTCY